MTTFRITYDGNNVDINVRRDGFKFNHVQKRNQLRSSSGKIQTVNQHGIQEIEITATFARAVYRQLFGRYRGFFCRGYLSDPGSG